MRLAKINVYLFRYSGPEDEISIMPILNYFKIIYHDGISKSTHFFYANESETIAYVDDIFQLLRDDVVDPFKMIQFTFPCFPSVLYKVAEFNPEMRQGIRDRLISVLRNWPESMTTYMSSINPNIGNVSVTNVPSLIIPDLDFII